MDGSAYDVHPFVLGNYLGDYNSLSMLAHEMGHALHSFLSNSTQPYVKSQYSIFLAEVASTLNEGLLIHHLLQKATDKQERLYLLNRYIDMTVGTFFNQFLPTIVGGDVVRGMDTAKPCGSLTKSLTIILFERFTGILVLLMLVSTGIALQIGRFKEVSYWPVFVLGFLVVGMVIFLWKEGIDLAFLERKIPFRIGKAIVHKISTVLDILVQFRSHPWPLVKVILLGLALQLLFILHYYLLSIAFSLDLPFSFFMVVIPVIFLLSMLPVSINGIGVRENLFVYFFAKVSVSPEKSLAIAWMAFVMILFYALIGGLIYMLRKGEKETISEIVDESEKLFE